MALRRSAWPVAMVVGLAVLACGASSGGTDSLERSGGSSGSAGTTGGSGGSGGGPSTGGAGGIIIPPLLGADCDPARSVRSDGPALLERDPKVLERFPIERVLQQIVTTGQLTITPLELLQRVFDTENTTRAGVFGDNVHCDDPANEAFRYGAAIDCPRAEGVLGTRDGFFVPGDPDSFVPVALINRFDLTPSSLATCGEYRIVYAKWSGRDDPNDRAFLIFEAALRNTQGIGTCRPVAELWAGLDDEPDATRRADLLEQFYFDGVQGFLPVIHAEQYGRNDQGLCDYGACGQLRLGQGMQAPWEFRTFRLQASFDSELPLQFAPIQNLGSPIPALFGSVAAHSYAESFQWRLVDNLQELTDPRLSRLRSPQVEVFGAGESAVLGPAQPNYLVRVQENPEGAQLIASIDQSLLVMQPSCPPSDPITAESVLVRAAAVSCAGCHAPEQVLPPESTLGCGQVWPASLGQTHIDEFGTLSPALRNEFLPYRADVFGTYLKACDVDAVFDNLMPNEVIWARQSASSRPR